MTIKALIFDVDGTLAETEDAHRIAFNRAFADAGMDWSWDIATYRHLLLTTGGKERMRAHAAQVGYTAELNVEALHARKTQIYKDLVSSGHAQLRPGVECLIRATRAAGLKLAIATTTSRPNLDALFENTIGLDVLSWFEAICFGDEVANKKPDPAIYRLALDRLNLCASQCVAFEDSRPGLLSAMGAGIEAVVITPSLYTAHHDFAEARVVLNDLGSIYSDNEAGSVSCLNVMPDPLPLLMRNCAERSGALSDHAS